jgi:hypothetical protein
MKKAARKLSMSRETIRNLDRSSMETVRGGALVQRCTYDYSNCYTTSMNSCNYTCGCPVGNG